MTSEIDFETIGFMEHLSKQQIVLLTLLVSFVTALATGIVTVSLMNQAPPNVTQTISRVIEQTIDAATPQQASVVDASFLENKIADAIDTVLPSVVKIKSDISPTTPISGVGLVVSSRGIIVTDKAVITTHTRPAALLADGTLIPLTIIQSQIEGDIVFLAPQPQLQPRTFKFIPLSHTSTSRLGALVWSLGGTSTPHVHQGIIERLDPDTGAIDTLVTSIGSHNLVPGSPLFNLKGNIIGMHTQRLGESNHARFYSTAELAKVMPK